MLTAKDGELDEAEALDTGADDFLSKPFSYVVLVARLRALMRRGAPRGRRCCVAGDIELDPADPDLHASAAPRSSSRRASSPCSSTSCAARARSCPKADILDHVWDFAFDGGDNVVEVHVSALRRKLGAESIETVRGAGYRMGVRGR